MEIMLLQPDKRTNRPKIEVSEGRIFSDPQPRMFSHLQLVNT